MYTIYKSTIDTLHTRSAFQGRTDINPPNSGSTTSGFFDPGFWISTQNRLILTGCTQNRLIVTGCTQNRLILTGCTQNRLILAGCTQNRLILTGCSPSTSSDFAEIPQNHAKKLDLAERIRMHQSRASGASNLSRYGLFYMAMCQAKLADLFR